MGWQIVFYLFYGLISGLAEILPVSASAQGYILAELTALDTRNPLMMLMMHAACCIVLLINFRQRIGHMRRELQLELQDPKRRKRQPDRITVLDTKIALLAAIPMMIMLALSNVCYNRFASLISLSITLVISGIAIYVPQFKPGANRDSRHLSPAEGVRLGLLAGLSVFPGISRMGLFLSSGLQRGCAKKYILDIALLASIPAMFMLMLLDIVALFTAGFATIDGRMVLLSCVCAVSTFGGAWLGVVVMRFLSMNANYSALAYYCWGLGLFSFILYLMV